MKIITPVRRSATDAGFTLIEIMIVVVMIGILSAIAIPAFQKITKRSQNTAFVNDLRIATEAIQRYSLENGIWPQGDGVTMPSVLEGYLPPPNRWHKPTPVGGLWAMSDSTVDTAFKASLLVNGYVGGTTRAAQIDKMFDDGNPETGFLRADGVKLTYILEQ
jgi:prepilin-type N-terminal cleavage/methylation domain-containing protein